MKKGKEQQQRGTINSRRLRWLIRAAIGLVGLFVLWSGRHLWLDFLAFIGDRQAVTAYVQGFGGWGPVLLGLLLSIQVVIAVIPGHILMITGGYLYGFSSGLAINLIGTVGTSQLVFALVRRKGRPLVNRLAAGHRDARATGDARATRDVLDRWQQVAARQGFAFFLFFFWFPIVPSNLMNFVAGLSSISFWHFFAANFLGRLPGVVLVTLVGSHGFALSAKGWVVAITGGLGLFFIGRYWATKLERRYFKRLD